jgi:hypothetical protein
VDIASSVMRRGQILTVAFIAAAALLLLATAPKAHASTSVYCGNQTLSGWADCRGSARTLNAVYGWGDQAGVCVSAIIGPTMAPQACTGNAGTGVYKPLSSYYYATPWIQNYSGKTNTVHGVAYQP